MYKPKGFIWKFSEATKTSKNVYVNGSVIGIEENNIDNTIIINQSNFFHSDIFTLTMFHKTH